MNALRVVDRDIRDWGTWCRMALEADPEDHLPALAVEEKCDVLWCRGRSTSTAAGVPGSPGRLGGLEKFQD